MRPLEIANIRRAAGTSVSALTLDLKREMQYSSVYTLVRGFGSNAEGFAPLPICLSFCLLIAVRLPTRIYRLCKGSKSDAVPVKKEGSCQAYLPLRLGENVVSVRRNKEKAVEKVHGERL